MMERLAAAAAVVLVIGVTVGCGGDDSSSSGDQGGTETTSVSAVGAPVNTSKVKGPGDGVSGDSVYYVGSGDINPWTKAFNHGVIDALEGEGADVTYLQDPFNPQVQVENLNRAVAAKPDMIVLLGLEYSALVPGLTRAKAADIPVFNMASPATPGDDLVTAQMLSDDAKLGEIGATNIIEGLTEQNRSKANVIAITGTAGLTKSQVREKSFEKVLKEEAPWIELVAVEDGNWDTAQSQRIARQLFAKYRSKGGIQGAFGMADNQALGIIQAAKESGIAVGGKDGLIVAGSNCYQAGLEAIAGGEQYGTGSESPFEESAWAAGLIIDWWNGEEIQKISYAEEEQITEANVDRFLEEEVCP